MLFLQIRPVSERQQEFYNRNFRCLVYLTYLLIHMSKTKEDKERTRSLLSALMLCNPREAITGNSLLHLCVTPLEVSDPSPVDCNRVSSSIRPSEPQNHCQRERWNFPPHVFYPL